MKVGKTNTTYCRHRHSALFHAVTLWHAYGVFYKDRQVSDLLIIFSTTSALPAFSTLPVTGLVLFPFFELTVPGVVAAVHLRRSLHRPHSAHQTLRGAQQPPPGLGEQVWRGAAGGHHLDRWRRQRTKLAFLFQNDCEQNAGYHRPPMFLFLFFLANRLSHPFPH